MKAKNFKQFVTEASMFPAKYDKLVMLENRVFVINDIIYHVDVEIAAKVGERDDEEIRHFGSRYFAEDWWLYDIKYCMRFKDPEINNRILTEIAEATSDVLGLGELGLTSASPKDLQSSIIDKAISTYPMEEPTRNQFEEVESILADQLKNDNYTEILYKSNDTFAETLNNILADEIGDLNGTDDDY
ncbi:hypothetical protein UFOVP1604_117 [uncultured Caudovirales phage]|uniref:Uncharacterized protein n=1 Tax=uncultured Caudovirales phage TaxID=2100421 RepID=A0A6J5SW81_9CAUD|nr:hypothetical protein UFOVP1604_117 [uncultured Caudovirales phage]